MSHSDLCAIAVNLQLRQAGNANRHLARRLEKMEAEINTLRLRLIEANAYGAER